MQNSATSHYAKFIITHHYQRAGSISSSERLLASKHNRLLRTICVSSIHTEPQTEVYTATIVGGTWLQFKYMPPRDHVQFLI